MSLETMTVEQALTAVDMISRHSVFSMEDIALAYHAARVLAAEVQELRADIDLSPEEMAQAVEVARSLDDAELTEFRHGRKNPRNLYSGDGPEHHFAAVVGELEHAEYIASWLIDAARAWEAAGHPFPPAPGPMRIPQEMFEDAPVSPIDDIQVMQTRQSGGEVW